MRIHTNSHACIPTKHTQIKFSYTRTYKNKHTHALFAPSLAEIGRRKENGVVQDQAHALKHSYRHCQKNGGGSWGGPTNDRSGRDGGGDGGGCVGVGGSCGRPSDGRSGCDGGAGVGVGGGVGVSAGGGNALSSLDQTKSGRLLRSSSVILLQVPVSRCM